MQTEQDPPKELDGMRLWQCARCEEQFATTGIDDVEQCPYCSAVVMAAAERLYTLSANLAGPEDSE